MKRKVWMMILSLLLMLCAGGLAACAESGEPGGPSGEDGHRHALQHVEAVAATCTKDGNIEYWYCPDCGKYFSDAAGTQEAASVAVKAAGHVWEKEWTKDEDAHWHACSVCGEPKEEISHEWGEAVRVKEPSCTEAGRERYECVCGAEKFEDIPMTEHVPVSDAWQKDEDSHWKICGECGNPFGEREHGYDISVVRTEEGYRCSYECTQCGYAYTAVEEKLGLEYTLSESEDFYIVTGVANRNAEEFRIADEIDGLPVREIAKGVFWDLPLLERVIIPSSVTAAPYEAFRNCPYLTICLEALTEPDDFETSWNAEGYPTVYNCFRSDLDRSGYIPVIRGGIRYGIRDGEAAVTRQFAELSGEIEIPAYIEYKGERYAVTAVNGSAFSSRSGITGIRLPDSVKKLGMSAFWNCKSLQTVSLPEGIEELPGSVFGGCEALRTVALPSTVRFIRSGAFSGSGLAEIELPQGVRIIESSAFAMTDLSALFLPASLEEIAGNALAGSASCTEITVDAQNAHYRGIDGVLFSADSGTLVIFPYAKTTVYTIPSGVTGIGEQAFYECAALEKVVFPEGVREIGEQAFSGCAALQVPVLPDSLEVIGAGAFSRCSSFEDLTVPENVTEIGQGAFAYCDRLRTVTLPFVGRTGEQQNGHFGYIFDAETYEENADCVPASLESVTITRAGSLYSNAFFGCGHIRSISLPAALSYVEERVFSRCGSLTVLEVDSENPDLVGVQNCLIDRRSGELLAGCAGSVIPEDGDLVTVIRSYAFYECDTLTEMTVPDNITWIGPWAFGGCTQLASLSLPFAGTGRAPEAYSYFGNIFNDGNVPGPGTIPGSLKTVEIRSMPTLASYVFQACYAVETLILPADLAEIEPLAFRDCNQLRAIEIDAENPVFYDQDGDIVIRRETKELVAAANGASIPADGSVLRIGDYAFYNHDVEELTVPECVDRIGEAAFAATKLERLTIPFVGESRTENRRFTHLFTGETWGVDAMPSTLTEVTVTGGGGIPEEAFAGCDRLQRIVLTGDIGSVGASAFSGCTSLLSVSLPEGVTELGIWAFSGCTSLTGIAFPQSLKTVGQEVFIECTSLSEISWGGVKTVEEYAFRGCTGLTELTVPSGMKSISDRAFDGCTGLAFVSWNSADCVIVPVTEDSYSGIFSSASLQRVTFPAGVVPSYIFVNTDVEELVLDGVTEIEAYAFAHTLLTEISIPASVTAIGEGIFEQANLLKETTVPFLGAHADASIEEATMEWFGYVHPDEVTILGGKYVGANAFRFERQIREVVLPDTLEAIGDGAFSGTGLESIRIPAGVRTIGNEAFLECKSLAEVTWAGAPESIGASAFSECDVLTEVDIPDGVQKIGDYAFSGCDVLTDIRIPASVTEMGNLVFTGSSLLVIRCEAAAAPEGWDAGWNGDYPVIWECAQNNIADNGYRYAMIGGLRYRLKDQKAEIIPQLASMSGELRVPASVSLDGTDYRVTAVRAYAFEDWDLVSVYLPEGFELIEQWAFNRCGKLERIVIPESITEIQGAFSECSSLKEVYYKGTSEQWDALGIEEEPLGENVALLEADRYYYRPDDPFKDGTAAEGENYWHYGPEEEILIWSKE